MMRRFIFGLPSVFLVRKPYELSDDAKQMAVRIAKVCIETLATSRNREVFNLIGRITNAMLPPDTD